MDELITDLAQLTPEELTRIFYKNDVITKGEAIKISEKSSHDYTLSTITFLSILYSGDTSEHAPKNQ